MNLKDARENYYAYSGKTSDIIRQLGLGGIAIVWLFHTGSANKLSIPLQLFLPLELIVAALVCDLLQYATAAFLWSFYHWRKERSGTLEIETFKAPEQINWPAIFFFYAKVVLIIVAYWHILRYLSVAISAGV
jgi:hypothetical protein